MKFKLFFLFALIASLFIMTRFVYAEGTSGYQGKMNFGIAGTGYYELSNWESLYIDQLATGIKAAGAGFNMYFEYGFATRVTGEVAAGFSRLTYATADTNANFRDISKENFFLIDLLGKYYFIDDTSWFKPYAAFGLGGIVSGNGAAPTLDVGFGSHFQVHKEFSLKFQLLYKTAVIHHRGEGSFGFAYHF